MLYKGLCMRSGEVDKNNNLYTKRALRKIAAKAKGKNIPVTLGFNSTEKIGSANVKFVEGKGLYCEITVEDIPKGNELYPAMSVKVVSMIKSGKCDIIKECTLGCIGLVEEHSDENIPAVTFKEE